MLCAMAMCVLTTTSCRDEKEEKESSGLKGWYTDLSYVARQSDFDKINSAINSHEVLSSYHYGGSDHTYVASRDLFIDRDGRFYDSDAYFGRLRFSIHACIEVIRIVDDQTLISYIGYLYETGASRDEAIYSLYAGPIFGNMTYYAPGSYYTYVKADNKLIVTNGDIYTITSEGLIKDGSSVRLSKYDPSKVN